jgi:hypothetical protein
MNMRYEFECLWRIGVLYFHIAKAFDQLVMELDSILLPLWH